MSEDRIEPTLGSFDLDDESSNDKNKLKTKALENESDLTSHLESDLGSGSGLESSLESASESDLEKELASLGEELKSFDFTDNNQGKLDKDDDFEIAPISIHSEETKKPKKAKPKKSKAKKSTLFDDIDENLPPTSSSDMETDGNTSPYEYRSSTQSKKEHNQDARHFDTSEYASEVTSWFSFSGRIDPVRATILVFASFYVCAALVTFADPTVKWLMGIFGSDLVNQKAFAFDPIMYASIGLIAYMSALLAITIRRLRDVNRSPLLGILLYLPPISLLIISYCIMPGVNKNNQYGAKPAPYTYKVWIAFALFAVLIPIYLYINSGNFGDYFWDIQRNQIVDKVTQ